MKTEVMFPSLGEFMNDGGMQSAFYEMWEACKNFSITNASNFRIEYGSNISLDTGSGAYAAPQRLQGNIAPNNAYPTIQIIGTLNDSPADATRISPLGSAVYVVGHFHTHPPTFYQEPYQGTNGVVNSRSVGPSEMDHIASQNAQLPGIVYDYEPVPNTPTSPDELPSDKNIPFGHGINAPAKLYPITPPERRPTPEYSPFK